MQQVHKALLSSRASSLETRAQPVEKKTNNKIFTFEIFYPTPSHCVIREMKNYNKTKKKIPFLVFFNDTLYIFSNLHTMNVLNLL
jgi:hypothetical protein